MEQMKLICNPDRHPSVHPKIKKKRSRCGKDIFWFSVNKYGRREQTLFKKQSQIK